MISVCLHLHNSWRNLESQGWWCWGRVTEQKGRGAADVDYKDTFKVACGMVYIVLDGFAFSFFLSVQAIPLCVALLPPLGHI